MELYRAGSKRGKQEHHTISIRYDHRSRPLYVLDDNDSTGVVEEWWYYWDLKDRLANVIHVPDTSDTTTYVVDSYVPMEPLAVGRNRAVYASGLQSEEFMYYATAPNGLPVAGYTFDSSGATSEVWRAEWTPFGTMLDETGDASHYRPPFRFKGQIELPNSDATYWNGSELATSRPELALNRWRVYDPSVGQYLQPEPMLIDGLIPGVHPYAYARLGPANFYDPNGRDPATLATICFASGACELLGEAGLSAVAPVPGARIAAGVAAVAAVGLFVAYVANHAGSQNDESCGGASAQTNHTAGGQAAPAATAASGGCHLTGAGPGGLCHFVCTDHGAPSTTSAICPDGCPHTIGPGETFEQHGCGPSGRDRPRPHPGPYR